MGSDWVQAMAILIGYGVIPYQVISVAALLRQTICYWPQDVDEREKKKEKDFDM